MHTFDFCLKGLLVRDSRKSRQKSGKNTAYFEKNREKHGKNTAKTRHQNTMYFQLQHIYNVHFSLIGRTIHQYGDTVTQF